MTDPSSIAETDSPTYEPPPLTLRLLLLAVIPVALYALLWQRYMKAIEWSSANWATFIALQGLMVSSAIFIPSLYARLKKNIVAPGEVLWELSGLLAWLQLIVLPLYEWRQIVVPAWRIELMTVVIYLFAAYWFWSNKLCGSSFLCMALSLLVHVSRNYVELSADFSVETHLPNILNGVAILCLIADLFRRRVRYPWTHYVGIGLFAATFLWSMVIR